MKRGTPEPKKAKKAASQRPTAARPDEKHKQRWIRGVDDSDLEKELARRARTNPRTVAPATGKSNRTPDSGFIFMRPVCDDYDCPGYPDPDDDTPPTDPCAGQSWVWQPDIAVQLNTGEADCPSAADLARIEHGLGSNLSPFHLSNPDVRVRCTAGKIYISIWGNRVQPDSCSEQARQRAQIPDLVAGGNFGLFINSSLIRRLADESFQAGPRRLSANGAPSSSGPIHLTGLSVAFKSPHTIETYVTGYDDRPWPDVYFTTTLTDELESLLGCTSTSDTESSIAAQIFSFLWLVALSVGIPLLIPVAGFVLFGDLDAALNQPDAGSEGGVGRRLLQTLPTEIPLPQSGGVAPPMAMMGAVAARVRLPDIGIEVERKKLVIAYAQPTVDDRGLFVGALAGKQDRIPAAHVNGPSSLSVATGAAQTFGYYTAIAQDFFGKLVYTWSAGANATIHNQGQRSTKITFKRGTTAPGSSFQRIVKVTVTDPEGSTATAAHDVSIFVNDSPDMSPLCMAKPWLPQCNP